MKIDDALRSLARLRRPTVPPFWSARVTARLTDEYHPRPTPRVMKVYWVALAAIGGPLLLTSWQRLVLVTSIAAALWVVAAMTPGDGSIGAKGRQPGTPDPRPTYRRS